MRGDNWCYLILVNLGHWIGNRRAWKFVLRLICKNNPVFNRRQPALQGTFFSKIQNRTFYVLKNSKQKILLVENVDLYQCTKYHSKIRIILDTEK